MNRIPTLSRQDFWVIGIVAIVVLTATGVFLWLTYEIFDWWLDPTVTAVSANTPLTWKTVSEIFRNFALVPAALMGAVFLIWRSIAANHQSKTSEVQAETALDNRLSELFQRGAEMLYNKNFGLKIAGIATLVEVASESKNRYTRRTTDCLKAFVEYKPDITGDTEPKKYDANEVALDEAAFKAIEEINIRENIGVNDYNGVYIFLTKKRIMLPSQRYKNIFGRYVECMIVDTRFDEGGFEWQTLEFCDFYRCFIIGMNCVAGRRSQILNAITPIIVQRNFSECSFFNCCIENIFVENAQKCKEISLLGCNISQARHHHREMRSDKIAHVFRTADSGADHLLQNLTDAPGIIFRFGSHSIPSDDGTESFPCWYWSDREPAFLKEVDQKIQGVPHAIHPKFRTDENQFDWKIPEAAASRLTA